MQNNTMLCRIILCYTEYYCVMQNNTVMRSNTVMQNNTVLCRIILCYTEYYCVMQSNTVMQNNTVLCRIILCYAVIPRFQVKLSYSPFCFARLTIMVIEGGTQVNHPLYSGSFLQTTSIASSTLPPLGSTK